MLPTPEHPLWSDQRICFVAPEKDDVLLLASWWSDRVVMEHNVPFALIPWSSDRALGRLIARQQNSDEWFWIIVLQDTHERIGHVGLQILDHQARVGRVSLLIGKAAYRGQGLGQSALKLLLHFGFTELNLHRIELNVLVSNQAALAVYTKLGFKPEGRLRSAVYRDNEYIDWIQMGLLRKMWKH